MVFNHQRFFLDICPGIRHPAYRISGICNRIAKKAGYPVQPYLTPFSDTIPIPTLDCKPSWVKPSLYQFFFTNTEWTISERWLKMKFSYKFSNLYGTVYRSGDIVFSPDGNTVISPVGNKISLFQLKNHKSETLPVGKYWVYIWMGFREELKFVAWKILDISKCLSHRSGNQKLSFSVKIRVLRITWNVEKKT